MPPPVRGTGLRGVAIEKSFGDGAARRKALKEVSLELGSGRFSLLMGPSGSGKSTLLAILSGLLEPDSGQVLAESPSGGTQNIWQMTANEREQFRLAHTGFIFQGYNLFPALTATQQLEIVLKWGLGEKARDARKRADAMLEKLGLLNQRNKKPAQLSGGEKQRVAIGRALVKNPMYIFADEPTSALDWENGQQVVQLLRDAAHDRGSTIFVVSHDQRILSYVDECYELNDGVLQRHHPDAMINLVPSHQNGGGL